MINEYNLCINWIIQLIHKKGMIFMKIRKAFIYLIAIVLAAGVLLTVADRAPTFIKGMIHNSASAVGSGKTVKTNNLILVNKDNPFYDEPEGLVSVYENKTKSYFVRDKLVYINSTAMDALNDMMDDFYKATSLKTIIVTSAYRSVEKQEELYNKNVLKHGSSYAEKYVQTPGNSEHHTGLAVDLGIFHEEDGSSEDFDGTGEYAWFIQNCQDYGFILRYPKDKEDITGIGNEPWHFRYVGKKHSKYIMNHGLCLEEYISLLG